MVHIIKVNIKKERKMVRENSFGQMEAFMKAIFLKIIFKDLENMFGMMEEFMKEIGLIIKNKVKENSFGMMVEVMKETLMMI